LNILLVEDDEDDYVLVRDLLSEIEGWKFDLEWVATYDHALEAFQRNQHDVCLIDYRLGAHNGLELLRRMGESGSRIPMIFLTGQGGHEIDVEAMKAGAANYLVKSQLDSSLLERSIRYAIEHAQTLEVLRKALKFRLEFEGVVGKSRAMERVMELVEKVADTDSSVVIEGETGTGKELIARCLHRNSPRRHQPFLPINCGALPEHLLESELFGHERGSFTGAYARKIGLLESAQGGTVLLDEISTLSPNLQVKLLRVLQERQVRRVGGQETIDIDIRVISATNENLEEAVAGGSFRKDLYYRLNVITISLPPLRERVEDIPLLAEHFLEGLNRERQRHVERISKEAMDILQGYAWPGNVRELQNVIERAFSLTDSGTITPSDLPAHLVRKGLAVLPIDTRRPFKEAKRVYIEPFEREYLTKLLLECRGNVSRSAQRAGLDRSSFQRLMKKYSIRSEDYRDA
jgi:DNA-binding NtrC family response regulator